MTCWGSEFKVCSLGGCLFCRGTTHSDKTQTVLMKMLTEAGACFELKCKTCIDYFAKVTGIAERH